MSDELSPDLPVELAFRITKRLGDCTEQDLEWAQERLLLRGVRNRAAVERLTKHLPPVCDFENESGFCERDADFMSTVAAWPRALCAEHHANLAG